MKRKVGGDVGTRGGNGFLLNLYTDVFCNNASGATEYHRLVLEPISKYDISKTHLIPSIINSIRKGIKRQKTVRNDFTIDLRELADICGITDHLDAINKRIVNKQLSSNYTKQEG